jgi:hypothetical protein
MKTLSNILFLFLLVNVAFAQSKDERDVEKSIARLTKAIVTYDTQTLDKLTSPLLTYGHSNGVIEDKVEFIQNVTGVINTIKLKVLLVWVKQKGDWILLARQAVK